MISTVRAAATRAMAAREYLRSTPFDTSTQEGRAKERYRRAALTAISAGAARGVSLISVLISIPLALSYLGAERYGVAVTITALTSILVFADFGLGNGLMNLVAGATGRENLAEAQRSISSAFFMLCALALVLAFPLYVLYLAVPWAEFMNVRGPGTSREVMAAVGVFMASVLLNLPLGIVQRVQLAFQEGFVNSVWNGVGAAAALIALFITVQLRAPLAWVVLTLVGGPVLANALNWIWLFRIRRRDLNPRWSAVSWLEGRHLAKVGFLFFVLQLTVAVAYQSDVVVATRVIGPAAATEYSVTLRLFLIAPTIVNMLLLPLWPAYSESIARGDAAWVERTLRVSILIASSISGAASLVLVIFGRAILHVWTGTDIGVDLPLLLGMGVWAVLSNSFNAVAMLLNGATIMRFQIATALSMAVVSLGASIAGAYAFGVVGIIWGTVLAYVACTAVPTAFYLPAVLRSITTRHPARTEAVG